jgi:hypothetical protein
MLLILTLGTTRDLAALHPWKFPGTHCIGGCVGPRAGLDGCEEEKISCLHRN